MKHQGTYIRAGCTAWRLGDHSTRHHEHAMGELHDLIEIGRVKEHSRTGRCSGAKSASNVCGRADVESASAILRYDHSRATRHFTCNHELLLVATAECRRSHVWPRSRDARIADELPRSYLRFSPRDRFSPNSRCCCPEAEHDVLCETERRDQPLGRPVLGNEAHRLSDLEFASERGDPSGDTTQQLPLTVAFDGS